MGFDWSPENLDREFPVRRNLVYWNHAAVAPLPRRVADAITAHTENARDRGAADWRAWYGSIEQARAKAEKLFPVLRPFEQRRRDAHGRRFDALRELRTQIECGHPDEKIVASELDALMEASREVADISEEEYAAL